MPPIEKVVCWVCGRTSGEIVKINDRWECAHHARLKKGVANNKPDTHPRHENDEGE